MTTRLEELKKGLVCLVPKDGRQGITCHEKTICDCTALRMIGLLERAKVFALYLGDSKSWNVVSDSAQWLKDLEEL